MNNSTAQTTPQHNVRLLFSSWLIYRAMSNGLTKSRLSHHFNSDLKVFLHPVTFFLAENILTNSAYADCMMFMSVFSWSASCSQLQLGGEGGIHGVNVMFTNTVNKPRPISAKCKQYILVIQCWLCPHSSRMLRQASALPFLAVVNRLSFMLAVWFLDWEDQETWSQF